MKRRILLLVVAIASGMLPRMMLGEVSERTRLAVEALLRLEDKDLGKNPALRSAIDRVAAQVGDEPDLVPLVAAFNLPGMDSQLLLVATRHLGTPESVQAIRLVLDHQGQSAIQAVLFPQQPLTAPLLMALASSADSRCVALVEPMVSEAGRPMETRRLAVRALAATPLGASRLVAMLPSRDLASDVRSLIRSELAASRFPGVREQLASSDPGAAVPAGALPAMSTLLTLRGNAERGKTVFQRPDVACGSCHQVGTEGVDFGPKLTGIGSKLGREGLIAAIVEPSSGIAFGYEGWRITLRDGEEWLGLLASDAADELLVKVAGGQTHRLPSQEIASREKLATSLMPSGLHDSLSTQDFVDLIEYLLSLKAGEPSGSR